MWFRTIAAAGVAALLATSGAYSQTTQAPPGRAPTAMTPAPGTTGGTMARPTTPSTTGSTAGMTKPPAGGKVNLNTADATQLDTLPGVGKVRANAILTERAKSPFKDWADFDSRTAHTSVNAGVKAKIKDMVTF